MALLQAAVLNSKDWEAVTEANNIQSSHKDKETISSLYTANAATKSEPVNVKDQPIEGLPNQSKSDLNCFPYFASVEECQERLLVVPKN